MNQSQPPAEERLQQVVIFEQLNERGFFIMKMKLKDMSLADWFRVAILLIVLLFIIGVIAGGITIHCDRPFPI